MSECICSSCKNLKSILNEKDKDKNGVAEDYECEYGYPSEECLQCDEELCELTCENYVSDCEEEKTTHSKCVTCGIELKVVSDNQEEGAVYCVTCYLNKK